MINLNTDIDKKILPISNISSTNQINIPLLEDYVTKHNIPMTTLHIMPQNLFIRSLKLLAHSFQNCFIDLDDNHTDFFIQFDINSLLVYIGYDILSYIKKCKTSDIIIIPVRYKYFHLNENMDGFAHANVLIIDNKNHTLEYYEPHGNTGLFNNQFVSLLIIENLKILLQDVDILDISLYKSIYNNTTTGLQGTDSYCVLWCFYITYLKLQNPLLNILDIEQYLIANNNINIIHEIKSLLSILANYIPDYTNSLTILFNALTNVNNNIIQDVEKDIKQNLITGYSLFINNNNYMKEFYGLLKYNEYKQFYPIVNHFLQNIKSQNDLLFNDKNNEIKQKNLLYTQLKDKAHIKYLKINEQHQNEISLKNKQYQELQIQAQNVIDKKDQQYQELQIQAQNEIDKRNEYIQYLKNILINTNINFHNI